MKKLLLLSSYLIVLTSLWAQDTVYFCDFDHPGDTAGWHLENGFQSNRWIIDTADGSGDGRLYVSTDATPFNYYDNSVSSLVYAYRRVLLERGAYRFGYDWRCAGERNFDYLRVYLVPDSVTLVAGSLPDGVNGRTFINGTPDGWTALDDGTALYQTDQTVVWHNYVCERVVSITDTYRLLFVWTNDYSMGAQPPAAVDNVVISHPACPAPVWPYVDNMEPTSFDLHWTNPAPGNAAHWIVELDSATQTLGQGLRFDSYDTVVSFTGLQPATDYTMYIWAVCGLDTLDSALSTTAHTPCLPITSLPYIQDFSSLTSLMTQVPCWTHVGGGQYVYVGLASSDRDFLYWYGDYGCYILLPGISTDGVAADGFQLSFYAQLSGTFEVGLVENPMDVAHIEVVDTVRIDMPEPDWERYVVEFSNSQFSILNSQFTIFIVLRSVGETSFSLRLADVEIAPIAACQQVGHLSVGHVGITSARLEWEVVEPLLHAPDSFEVRVGRAGESPQAWVIGGVSRYCQLTGLTPHADYRAWVRVRCENDSLSGWDSVDFATLPLPCLQPDSTTTDSVVAGTETNQVSGVPVKHDWNNSLCQSIYTASELHGMGMTEGMVVGMDYGFTSSPYNHTFSIYMTKTSRTHYGDNYLMGVGEGDLVYGPAFHAAGISGTVHYEFDTPFWWDGDSNVVVTTVMSKEPGDWHGSSFYGYSTLVSGWSKTMYRYATTPFTSADLASGRGTGSEYRPSVTFYTMPCGESVACLPPMVWVDSVGEDAAVVAWTPGLHETSWRVMYRQVADTTHVGMDTMTVSVNIPWTLADTHLTANSYRLTSLLPAQRYEARVEHVCGGDTLWNQVGFLTLCTTVDTLPLVEDFEDFVAPDVADGATELCWYRATTGTYIYAPAPCVSPDNAYSGTQSLRMRSSSSRTKTYIVLPAMGMELWNVQLDFRTYSTADYMLRVGVMTDPTLPSTFAEVRAVSPTVLGQWEAVEVPLEDYTGSGRYIALMMEGMIGGRQPQDVWLDDLRVDYISPCPRPRNVTVGNVTQTTAMLFWRGQNAIGYEVEYGPTGFAHGTGTVVTSTTDSLLLMGLSHSTYYDVYVRSLCSESGSVLIGDTSVWSFVTTFLTDCGMIESLPYTQRFVDRYGLGDYRPVCWVCGSNYANFVPSVVGRTDNMGQVVGSALCMPSQRMFRSFALLPAIDTAVYPIHMLQVVVKAGGDTTGSNYAGSGRGLRELIVGVCPTADPLGSFTPVDTLRLSEVPMVYEVPLSAAVGAGGRIAFMSANLDGINERRMRYIDSVAVEPLPSCPRPYALHATAVTDTTATIAWSSPIAASQWQVEYMPHGVPVGTGTRVVATSPTLTLTGLLPSTYYDFYVRTLCVVGDTSGWSYAYGSFITSQVPASVPYYYDFDTLQEWDSWQSLSNSSACWYRGMADGQPAPGIYLSADSGNTRGTLVGSIVNAACYRDIDFGNLDTAYLLSFRASVGGGNVGGNHYDGLAVFLTDPSVPPAAPSYVPYQSPWGHRDSLDLLADIGSANYWRDYSFVIDSLRGVHRLVFFWYNYAPSNSSYSFVGQPAAVDNVSIGYDPCPRPTRVRLTSLSATTATLAWHGSEYDGYRVELLTSENLRLSVDTTYTTGIQFTGLIPATTYKVYIEHLCNSATSVQTASFTFSTDVCTDGISDTVGTIVASGSRHDVPLNTVYPYSYTQQLVHASELHGAGELGTASGEITSINFCYSGSRPMTAKTNCTIYMGHTLIDHFATAADFVPPAMLQPVYVGNLNCANGWNRVYLDSPFAYDGTSNILVAIGDNSGIAHNGSYGFASVATAQPMTLAYSAGTAFDFSTDASLRAFEGSKSLLSHRALMSLDFCPPNPCPPPALLPAEVHVDSVVLRWRRQPTLADTAVGRYMVGYRLRSDSRWTEDNIPVFDTFYTIGRLLYFDTDYVYHVRQHCDSGRVSNWAFGTFNTGDIPCRPPAGLAVTEVANHAVRLSWTPDGNHICYCVRLWGSGFDTLLTTYIAGCRIDGLNPNSQYRASVQVVCEYHDTPSLWSDTVTFETEACPESTDLTALEVHGNSVLLDWQCEEGVGQWLVEWGLQGFDQGTGTLVTADHHPFLLTGLTGETTYDIIVRSVCSDGYVSEGWSNRLTVTTAYSGIDQDGLSILNTQISIHPNPTTGDVELQILNSQISNLNSLRVEVVDIAGRNCLNVLILDCLSAGASNTQTIKQSNYQSISVTLPTSQLPQGAYYVRVTGNSFSAITKALKID